ncbi:DUF1287 domain-containing protein [Novosphingobium sp.]|uniref:DUF1287 domain-containing protein n=1 Tax=Novosphingobium sp. TaxID=1874826 RepID=UPI0025D6ECFD|nr:DUF1287 domain-containing protein [Novosphingobium sp.]
MADDLFVPGEAPGAGGRALGASTRRGVLGGAFALLLAGCERAARAEPVPASAPARRLIAAARRQVGVTLSYDPAYTALAYPLGDVPRERGVCTDVLIRAYRDALGVDLQREVHQDMAGNFAVYPRRWGLRRPDRNIDHRRVPNLQAYWSRQGARLALSTDPAAWQPGDVFTSLVGGTLPHIGIVSDRLGTSGRLLVIHNIGAGTREEDALLDHPLTGRFRWRV